MAKSTIRKAEASGSESESELPKSVKKGAASKNVANNKERDASEEPDQKEEENGDGGDDDEGDEEEYEIEAILDAKHGSFPNGRTGYLVKWKGYSEEHNSWVDERDAEGAKELIEEFWKNNSKKASAARKLDTKPKPKPTPKPRKSSARATTADESDIEEVAPPPKKRGRPSKASARSPSEEQEQQDEEAPKKKPRKGSTTAKSASARRAAARPEDSDEDDEYVDMKRWKDASSWEHLVECIDTVERMDDGGLLVYFTLKHGKGHGKEPTEVCKRKMPNLLIDFYQSNLRWKTSEEDAMEE